MILANIFEGGFDLHKMIDCFAHALLYLFVNINDISRTNVKCEQFSTLPERLHASDYYNLIQDK